MPLLPGKENIGKNIATEVAAGKPQAQAVAIALHKADDNFVQAAPESVTLAEINRRNKQYHGLTDDSLSELLFRSDR